MTPETGKRCRHLVASVAILAALVAGCTPLESPPTPGPTTRQAPPARPPDPASAEIDRLLTRATLAFEANRLTTPVDDNAYFRYMRVLSLDPDNARALQGLSRIVEKYLSWAIDNADRGRFGLANRYLTSARAVEEDHPGIESVSAYVAEQQASARDVERLSPAGLDRRDARLVDQLHRLAHLAEERDALVIIRARNDAEGRWIYQQMNEATELRLRARLELNRVPSIRMIYPADR